MPNKETALAPAKKGRKTLYNKRVCAEIRRRLIKGESLASICRDKHMPHEWTVWNWTRNPDHPFSKHYARARELQADHYFDKIIDTAKTATPENVQCVKLVVDTIKWSLAKQNSKRYGDKSGTTVNVDNSDNSQNLTVTEPSEEQWEKYEAMKLRVAEKQLKHDSGKVIDIETEK